MKICKIRRHFKRYLLVFALICIVGAGLCVSAGKTNALVTASSGAVVNTLAGAAADEDTSGGTGGTVEDGDEDTGGTDDTDTGTSEEEESSEAVSDSSGESGSVSDYTETGDTSHAMVWVSIVTAALFVIIFLLAYRKRKEQAET